MISSKHVLITFTILSASIWFMPASGVTNSSSIYATSINYTNSNNDVSHTSDSDATSVTLDRR